MSTLNFASLRDLHNSVNNLLHLTIIRQSLVQKQWVDEVSEASLRMLDTCGATKDVLLLVKDHLQDLQSTFRRVSTGEKKVESKFEAYYLERKKLKKEILKRLSSLKGMKKSKLMASPMDRNLGVVVSVLRGVRVTTMAIVESLVSLMSMPSPKRKSKKWIFSRKSSIFSGKLMRENSISLWRKCDLSVLQSGKERLEAVDNAIEDLEVELECMFRRLIQTRVSLLNILTN
ncbi:Lateral signaling target protein [Actinidia chinensis var. chinensis]|uniref:Lateral signaling target protein n=1 Tax=Actinidia chinensis var. chinensis TaxID=1590841 RepID=A0A2R6R056_ACTCC|nr:Lateral signaling target protein [Actinidia chinensis var. chinensis]